MNVLVTLEKRFLKTPDGAVWTRATFGYEFWQRYLEVFDGVKILARTKDVELPSANWQRVDGPGVSLVQVPYYVGPLQYLLRARTVSKATKSAVKLEDAIILRVPSWIAVTIYRLLIHTSHPYGVEVVGDPYDVFAPNAVKHPLRPLLRWWFPQELRRHCYSACGAAYVTKEALQRRYPTNSRAYTTYYSDVELPREAFVSSPRKGFESSHLTLIFVGTLQQLYKAPDVLIKAFAACIKSGLTLRLEIVGDGQYRPALERLAAQLGVTDKIIFTGQLSSGAMVRERLDKADIFVLPSHQEGLPRAMLEAMARGLPCIGSTVGGIPELLNKEDLVPPGDIKALAARISEVVSNPIRLATMSQRNLRKSHDYDEAVLRKRRVEFYRYIRDNTERWQKGKKDQIATFNCRPSKVVY